MASLEKNKEYYGFRLIDIEKIEDIESIGYEFFHVKSGAKLIYIKNDDDNKVFYIAFKTPPNNNNGTAHIIEHSVLCGSEKYSIKDPFNELSKGSLNTYLNAMTYSDKTVYPVASRNEKDFYNLIDVYMDAVFNPLIKKNEKIFMQEGWHYELFNPHDDITIKGVVYNEMKGAYSDSDRILDRCIKEGIFKSSPYRFDSGGNPSYIPDLTYGEFIDYYDMHYHPSNSYIYIYGDTDILKYLQYINENYLSKYDITDNNSYINIKSEKSPANKNWISETYPILKGDKKSNDNIMGMGFIAGSSTDVKRSMALDILNYILIGTNASLLKKAIIGNGIAEIAEGWFGDSSLDMVYTIVAKNAKDNMEDSFIKTIGQEINNILEQGLNKDLVSSAINKWEFLLREEDYGYKPKGLVYGLDLLKTWLHKDNPLNSLKTFGYLEEIKNESENGYFERLIREIFIDNEQTCFVTLKAEEEKQDVIDTSLYEKLSKYKKTLGEAGIEELIEKNIDLLKYQSESDSEEAMASIPMLDVSKIRKEAEYIDSITRKIDHTLFHLCSKDTRGIVYIKLLFKAENVPKELIPYLGLLSELLGKIDTGKYSFDNLLIALNNLSGSTVFKPKAYMKNSSDHIPVFSIDGKVLKKNVLGYFGLLKEILNNSSFVDKENIRKIIKETINKYTKYFLNNGHGVAMKRGISRYSNGYRFLENSTGIGFLDFLIEIDKNLDYIFEDICMRINEVLSLLKNRNNIIVSITTTNEDLEEIATVFNQVFNSVNDIGLKKQDFSYDRDYIKEGLYSSSKVNNNIGSLDYNKCGFSYCGNMQVLKTMVSREYLWNKVRIQGGAYGAGCVISRDGNICLYSYRDPNIDETYEIYNGISNFLKNVDVNKREFSRYVLGAINEIDRPKSNNDISEIALKYMMTGITHRDIQKERDELLSSTIDDIKRYHVLFDCMCKKGNLCTVGGSGKVNEHNGIFNSIRPLINKES